MMIQSQDSAKQNVITSAIASSTPTTPPWGRNPRINPTIRISAEATEYRNRSPASAPRMGDACHIGSERKRSKRPFWMSVFNPIPVYTVMKTMVCTSTPGSRYWMYSRGDPASAPPKM